MRFVQGPTSLAGVVTENVGKLKGYDCLLLSYQCMIRVSLVTDDKKGWMRERITEGISPPPPEQ